MSCIEQLEKAEEQEKLLEESKVKLEKRRQKEDEMRKQLQKTEVDLYTYTHIHTHMHTHTPWQLPFTIQEEHALLEEKYASLQEEATGKTKKLKEVWKQFQASKDEVGNITLGTNVTL